MAVAKDNSPFLSSCQDFSKEDEDDELMMLTQSRCFGTNVWNSACRGEREMQEVPARPMYYEHTPSTLTQQETTCWSYQTHTTVDMSGFTQQTIYPLSDELCNFSSTDLNCDDNNDFYASNCGNQSSPQTQVKHQDSYSPIREDSTMWVDNNYSEQSNEIDRWLISDAENYQFEQSFQYSPLPSCTDCSSAPLKTPEEKKTSIISKPLGQLSIFKHEEPLIKEESEVFSENKMFFEDDCVLDVAAEEEVSTEEPASPELLFVPSVKTESKSEISPSFYGSKEESAEYMAAFPMKTESNDNLLGDEDLSPSLDQMDWSQETFIPLSSVPSLQLNITAAIEAAELDMVLPDTPEVLKPVLKPPGGFDLINFLTGDSNNNVSALPLTPVAPKTLNPLRNPLLERRQRARGRGKSQLAMQEVKSSLMKKPATVTSIEEQTNPISVCESSLNHLSATPSTSTSDRPRRESASRFNKRLEEGLLHEGSPDGSDEEEVFSPKKQRRRTTSSPSKQSDFDFKTCQKSESYDKYRERRDRNNISSKLSRQKRKMAQKEKELELAELMKRNRKLKLREKELADAVKIVLSTVCRRHQE